MADHAHHIFGHSLYPEGLDRALWIAVLVVLVVTVGGMFATAF